MTRTKIAILAAALALAGASAFLAGRFFAPAPTEHVDLTPHPYTTMHGPESKEWVETHFPGPDGKDQAVYVDYRDTGETGLRIYKHPNHALSEETIWNADGKVRLHALYHVDGQQIVTGFELRRDGTKLWEAKLDNNTVTRTTWWYDGKTTFSVESRDIGSPLVNTRYFYKSGRPWMHYVGSTGPAVETIHRQKAVEVFAPDNTMVVTMMGDEANALVKVFHKDGSLAYVQEWVPQAWYKLADGTPGKRLGNVNIYSPDGTRVVRTIEVHASSYGVTKVTDYDDKGGHVDYVVSPWGDIISARAFDSDGRDLGPINLPTTLRLELDKAAMQPFPLPNPVEQWQLQESNPAARNNDGTTESPVSAPVENR